MKKWYAILDAITHKIEYYKALLLHSNTPVASKWLIGTALAYLASPIDIIPDFIPVFGQLDDLMIVPVLIFIAMLLIPPAIKKEARQSLSGIKTNTSE